MCVCVCVCLYVRVCALCVCVCTRHSPILLAILLAKYRRILLGNLLAKRSKISVCSLEIGRFYTYTVHVTHIRTVLPTHFFSFLLTCDPLSVSFPTRDTNLGAKYRAAWQNESKISTMRQQNFAAKYRSFPGKIGLCLVCTVCALCVCVYGFVQRCVRECAAVHAQTDPLSKVTLQLQCARWERVRPQCLMSTRTCGYACWKH